MEFTEMKLSESDKTAFADLLWLSLILKGSDCVLDTHTQRNGGLSLQLTDLYVLASVSSFSGSNLGPWRKEVTDTRIKLSTSVCSKSRPLQERAPVPWLGVRAPQDTNAIERKTVLKVQNFHEIFVASVLVGVRESEKDLRPLRQGKNSFCCNERGEERRRDGRSVDGYWTRNVLRVMKLLWYYTPSSCGLLKNRGL